MKRRAALFVLVALFGFSTTSFGQSRDLNLVRDSLLNDLGIVMPKGVYPTSYFGEENCHSFFADPSNPLTPFLELENVVEYVEVCVKVFDDGAETERVRFVDVRVGYPKRVLIVVRRTLAAGGSEKCEVWPNEGFWSGGEPSDKFLPSFLEKQCGENAPKYLKLRNKLMQTR